MSAREHWSVRQHKSRAFKSAAAAAAANLQPRKRSLAEKSIRRVAGRVARLARYLHSHASLDPPAHALAAGRRPRPHAERKGRPPAPHLCRFFREFNLLNGASAA